MKHRNFVIMGIVVMSALLLVSTGCIQPSYYAGGGWLYSDDGSKANFGFLFNSCDLDNPQGTFNYVDRVAGVKMNGELTGGIEIGPWDVAVVSYRSTNPKNRGEGQVQVTVVDMGEGTDMHGWLKVRVLTGPYAGYVKEGTLEGGNIQDYGCLEIAD